jgi:hypothetical protein
MQKAQTKNSIKALIGINDRNPSTISITDFKFKGIYMTETEKSYLFPELQNIREN